MEKVIALFMLFSVSMAHSQTNHERLNSITNLTRIAFGSCNDQNDAQPLWRDMIRQKPDLFIWGGDNIYADWQSSGRTIKDAYDIQNKKPGYVEMKSQTPIIGTWDDHDYAYDNATGYYSGKKESQKLFLDFIEEPASSPRRSQEGIYTSYEFGEADKRIRIILLDNRYFKSLDPEAPLLGKKQWAWLENEFKNTTPAVNIIVSGLSITSPLIPYTEEWAENPVEINRMLHLVKTYKPKGVIFLTGDKHFSSIFRRYGQLEFMSSGMTHIAPRRTWWYLGRKYPKTFFGLSYGQIDFDWDGTDPLITLSMRDTSGRDVHQTIYKWKSNNWVRQ